MTRLMTFKILSLSLATALIGSSLAQAKGAPQNEARTLSTPENLESQATKELTLAPADLSPGVLPTPATVRLRVEGVKNPVRPLVYRLGVSVQPYTPAGTMHVSDLPPYALDASGTSAMVALEGQWLPIHFKDLAGLLGGGYLSIGYAQSKLNLRSPTGLAINNTKLNSIKAEGGFTASYLLPKSPLWSVHGNLGGGRLTLIQASSSSFANASASLWFAAVGAGVERSLLPNFSAFLAYDLRVPVSSDAGADLSRHNVLVGFLGNFE